MAFTASELETIRSALLTFLSSSESLYQSVGSDGTSRTVDRAGAWAELKQIDAMLGRANGSSPMFARGVVKGLR